MAGRWCSSITRDSDLRRTRRLVTRAAREFGAPLRSSPVHPAPRPATRRPLTFEARRQVIAVIAELDLLIKALRRRREEIGHQAGLVFRNRQVASAYGRVSQVLRQDKRARR
jgi:hypothetical protein